MSADLFFAAIYRQTAGNSANLASALKIGEELRLSSDETKRVVQQLIAEGLIKHVLSGHRIGLTAAGCSVGRARQEVEALQAKESDPSESRQGIFVSYSHLDARWLERLEVHLRPLAREGLEIWNDTRIEPSSDWRQEIRRAIEDSAVAVLLVSANFLASDFIDRDELPPLLAAAEERGMRILSLILSASAFERTPLARFQAFNPPSRPLIGMTRNERERIFATLAATIAKWMHR